MFGNLVNAHDLRWFCRKLLGGRLLHALSGRLSPRSRSRVEAAWSHTDAPPTNCWDIPAVQARWNRLRTGCADTTWPEYVAKMYLSDGRSRRAISLGCGAGAREVAWAKLGVFESLVGWDLSAERIERARRRAEEEGVADVLRFEVGDVNAAVDQEGRVDVVLCEQSLHHFSPLEELLAKIHESLEDDGLFVIDEFVGPTRYQWPDRQVEAVNHLLGLLPDDFRFEWDGATRKRSHFRPSRLRMILLDPSEAVESEKIVPLLHETFEVVEQRDYGGTLLQFALSGISHHFLADEEEPRRLLEAFFAFEDSLLARGELSSDYSAIVSRKRG